MIFNVSFSEIDCVISADFGEIKKSNGDDWRRTVHGRISNCSEGDGTKYADTKQIDDGQCYRKGDTICRGI